MPVCDDWLKLWLDRRLLSGAECGSETAVGLDADRYSEGEAQGSIAVRMSSSTMRHRCRSGYDTGFRNRMDWTCNGSCHVEKRSGCGKRDGTFRRREEGRDDDATEPLHAASLGEYAPAKCIGTINPRLQDSAKRTDGRSEFYALTRRPGVGAPWLNVARVGVCCAPVQASPSRMNACCKSSVAAGRSSCSISKVWSRKSFASAEMSSGTVGRLDEPICRVLRKSVAGSRGEMNLQSSPGRWPASGSGSPMDARR